MSKLERDLAILMDQLPEPSRRNNAEWEEADRRDRFLSAFKCRICGKPGNSLTIQPPDIGTAGGGHSLS
jgi:hypothetical protein